MNLKRSEHELEPTHNDQPMDESCRVNRFLINTEGHQDRHKTNHNISHRGKIELETN